MSHHASIEDALCGTATDVALSDDFCCLITQASGGNKPITRMHSQHARSDLVVVVKNKQATSFKRSAMLPLEEAHGVDAQIGKVAAHLVVHGLGDHGRRNGCVSTSVEGPGAPRVPTLFVSANSAAGCHRWHRPRLHQGRGVLGRVTLVLRAVASGHGNPQANMLPWSKGFREGGHHGAAAALHLLHVKHHALVVCRGRVRNRGRDGRHLRDGGTSAELGPSQLHRSEEQHTGTPLRSGCTTNRWPATRLRGTARHRRLLQRQYSQREHPPTQQRMRPSSS